jgi:hypothetical protein
MDCASTLRGIRLATGAAIYRSRSGLCLWRCLYPSRSRDGHSGPADRTTIAMAERTCGEAHRFDLAAIVEPLLIARRFLREQLGVLHRANLEAEIVQRATQFVLDVERLGLGGSQQ